MQNKGSALIFLFVLFVMCLGAYGAVSTLMKGRSGNVIALETLTPIAGAETSATSSIPVPTDTPGETSTPNSELSTPVVPTATPIPPATPTSPPQPTATPTPAPTGPVATPPPPPVGEHLFRTTRNERDCQNGQGYIRGMVYDANRSGLSDVNVHLYNYAGYDDRTLSKAGAIDMGAYDFPMGPDEGRFYLEIVDSLGNPISAAVVVDYLPGCTSYVDWQRVR